MAENVLETPAGDDGGDLPVACTEGMVIASSPVAIGKLRETALHFLSGSQFSDDDRLDILTALGEACSNACRHGSPRGESDTIRLTLTSNDGMFTAEVSDNGHGFRPERIPDHDPEKLIEGGMGLYLMRQLMDKVEFEFHSGTTVRLIKYFQSKSKAS